MGEPVHFDMEAQPDLTGGAPSLSSPEAIAFVAAHASLWVLVLMVIIVRIQLCSSDRKTLRESRKSGDLEQLTNVAFVRECMAPFDVCVCAGATLLCLAPVYLAGAPSRMLCHLRTSILPVGLSMLSGGQMAKTVVTSRLIGYEWMVRAQVTTRAAAIRRSRQWARTMAALVYAVVAVSLAVVTGWTPQLLEHTSPVLPSGYLWTACAIQLPILAFGAYLAVRQLGMRSADSADQDQLGTSTTQKRVSARVSPDVAYAASAEESVGRGGGRDDAHKLSLGRTRLRQSAAMRHANRILGGCNVATTCGGACVLAAILSAARDVGSTPAYTRACALILVGVALQWAAVLLTIYVSRRSEALLLAEETERSSVQRQRHLLQAGFDDFIALMATTTSLPRKAMNAQRRNSGSGSPLMRRLTGGDQNRFGEGAMAAAPTAGTSVMVSAGTSATAVLRRDQSVKMTRSETRRLTEVLAAASGAIVNVPEDALPLPLPTGASADDDVALLSCEGNGSNAAGAAVRAALVECVAPLPPADFRARLEQSASRLRDPAYTLREFHDDMLACFPELQLYLYGAAGLASGTSSGRSGGDEYKRTLGALFAVYWLVRLDLPGADPESRGLDGQRGWTFGSVDAASWAPPTEASVRALREGLTQLKARSVDASAAAPQPSFARKDEARTKSANAVAPMLPTAAETAACEKQLGFFDGLDWAEIHRLVLDAGLLVPADVKHVGASGVVKVHVERTMAMLALTAIHDIMKIDALLPTVLPEHAPYHGVSAGERIHDHDVALGYVLEHDPGALPGFAALDTPQQRPIRFTQAQLGFNHGWLVQAEAPPGALFSNFKRLLDEGGASPADIAFYFVHWLTDLAGAVPSPLSGCQQFVRRFPLPVLAAFTRSFPLVQRLALTSETALNEEFLAAWWPAPILGPVPAGADAIALMRLSVHCQADADRQLLVDAWSALPDAPRETLACEMARTGIRGQAYSTRPANSHAAADGYGPALLIYYAPAYLRGALHDEPLAALLILAEVYRAARALFPCSPTDEARAHGSVTVHIGQLKAAIGAREIVDAAAHGDGWLMVKKGETEAVVERRAFTELVAPRDQLASGGEAVLLEVWPSAVPLESEAEPVR